MGYASTLRGMVGQWQSDDDMGHGFLVPVVILWIVWRERERWRKLPTDSSWWGFALLAAGAGMHTVGAIGAGLFASSLGFLLSLTGTVLCLGGFGLLRAWMFPLLLTLFMLPKLAIVYNQATLPLQLLASRIAATMLTVTGIGVIREGNILDVGGHRVAVAEACNGIRFLLPLGFLAVVFAYVSDPKAWMRLAILAAVIPVAIIANALRVAVAAWLPAFDSGMPHEAEGAVIFVLSLSALPLLQRLFNSVYARAHA
ncbi:MAG TPA: exosortase/archaeosortase family protein [Bryobacteraceae bacterium]